MTFLVRPQRRRSGRLALTLLAALLLTFPATLPTPTRAQTDPSASPAGTATTLADATLRSEPSYDAPVLLSIPSGTSLTLVDGPFWGSDGAEWFATSIWGSTGYVAAAVLAGTAAPATSAAAAPNVADPPAASSAAPAATISTAAVYTATTTSSLNLRSGPSTTNAILLVIPAGAPVTVTGDPQNGFLPVTYGGTAGWAFAQYLSSGPAVPAPSPPPTTGTTGSAITTTTLNLRAGPSTADAVLTVIPAGAPVVLTGQSANGFLSVSYNGTAGWAYAAYLAQSGTPPPTTPTPSPQPAPTTPAGTATTTASLNLRAGPSTADAVLLVLPPGATVAVTGQSSNGFASVSYTGVSGWAFAQYLASGSTPAPTTPTNPTPAPTTPTGTATTTAPLNLRAGPSTADAVVLVMPAGAIVTLTGSIQNGFYPLTYNGTGGWASGSYLSTGGSPSPSPTTPPTTGSTGIIWPFRGGPWTVIQGYNNGTHTNRSAFAQYKYALDFALAGGTTAGQPVYAPVSGSIRWVDRGSGGMLIDAGNGYGVAFFHVTVAGGFASGQRITAGQYVGTVSGPGGEGYAATPHIDLTLWQFTGGGHIAAPFTGPNAISGRSFPDTGGTNQYYGVQVYG